jgi:hypothetical protein
MVNIHFILQHAAWSCYCTHAQNGGTTEVCRFKQQQNCHVDDIPIMAGGWGLVCLIGPYKNATDWSYIQCLADSDQLDVAKFDTCCKSEKDLPNQGAGCYL